MEDDFVASDLTELDKRFIRVEVRFGPKATGISQASEWIEIKPESQPTPTCLLQLATVAKWIAGQLSNQVRYRT